MTQNQDYRMTVEKRQVVGKKVKTLRQAGLLPGNIVIPGETSVAVAVNAAQFNKLYAETGETGLIYLELDSQTRPTLVDEVVYHPITNTPDHVVFKQVDLSEKITAEIPVELVGENKVSGGVVVTVHPTIEVEALPTDLPDHFEVDISTLTEIGQDVTFNQLKFDRSKVTLMISEEELDSPVVLLQEVKEEVVEEPTAEEVPAEGGAEGATKDAPTAEGEAAQE